MPFALTHEAVGSLSATKDKWIGSLEIEDAAMFTDIYLLLIFGGIPWQVRSALRAAYDDTLLRCCSDYCSTCTHFTVS